MADDGRPNPEALLARAGKEARKQTHGRLKIFFGSSAGVGKTYAMLEAARAQNRNGVDVVAGVVETHGRSETESLLDGLEVLPLRALTHRGIAIEEFDLDGALARRPALLLVDELAHTNAPGSRHAKRWQDVFELVAAGIDVYTTLNVQHLDALNDVVAQVTGVPVRETIPDSVFDQADDIELVDLPVDELLHRMNQGKVYLPAQVERAKNGFFRPGNLIALREMALRRAADRVDAQMRTYRHDNSIASTWPVVGRLMVSIGPSPYSAKLIRAAKRMAERLQAEWIVAFVETPAQAQAPPEVRHRVLESLRLAEQLGAETVTLSGSDVAGTLLQFARSRNVSRLVVGKQPGPLWLRLWRGSVFDELIGRSGDIEVTAISGTGEPRTAEPRLAWKAAEQSWWEYWPAFATVTFATAAALALRPVLNPVNLVMVYLLAVALVAMRSSRRVAFCASLLSVAAFDFFCVPPYLTFAVQDYEYLLTFAAMLTVAMLISTLTIRTRAQAARAVEREARTNALHRLTRELAAEPRWFEAARAATAATGEVFGMKVTIFFPDETGQISFQRRTTDELPVPTSELGIAQWVFDHGQKAGRGMDTLPGASALYLPLKGPQQVLGVMTLVSPKGEPGIESPEQHHLLEIFASQIALAIERSNAANAVREAQLLVETEQMRSTLSSAVSHDLRTPLATITGAATTLLTQGGQLSGEVPTELLMSIVREAERLNRLVGNLLDMTRLESGQVRLKRAWHSVEEIVGAALGRLQEPLAGRAITTRIPADLPLIRTDDVLLGQVFFNLLENAVKYTPAGSPLTLAAWAENGGVTIEFSDAGPGFAPGEETRIWEKFYRGKSAEGGGSGLGLAICDAIVKAHQGSITAHSRPEGGARIRIWIPIGGTPPLVPADA